MPTITSSLASVALACLLATSASLARADDSELLRAQINAVRAALIGLAEAPDQRTPQRLEDIASLIDKVDGRLQSMPVPIGQQQRMNSLRSAWLAYRTTLVTDVLPALRLGQDIQSHRPALAQQQQQRVARVMQFLSPPQASTAVGEVPR